MNSKTIRDVAAVIPERAEEVRVNSGTMTSILERDIPEIREGTNLAFREIRDILSEYPVLQQT